MKKLFKKEIIQIIGITSITFLLFSTILIHGSASHQKQQSIYDLLILCPDSYYDLLSPLADHKNSVGRDILTRHECRGFQ